MNLSLTFPVIAFILIISGCNGSEVPGTKSALPRAEPRLASVNQPVNKLSLPSGTDIPVLVSFPDTLGVDSVRLYLDGQLLHTLTAGPGFPAGGPLEARIPTAGLSLGGCSLRIQLYFSNGSGENHSRAVTLLAGKAPVDYSYQVVNTYAHDPKAYTQGLQYVDGWLYEGTGNYGTSSLRRVKLETGEVDKIRNMDASMFGEGITVLGEKIYQLTYKSQVGFVYDRSTFEELQKIYYQNKEGWGLTHNGSELIMSDGTNIIYFLDPELFTVKRQIEVYTEKGPAQSLNELEFIDGKIWANRYFTDEIVIIDPETGAVEGRINLKGILRAADRKPSTDVLNGIAWDEAGRRIYVTGKRWPKLFEIRIK